MSILRKMEVPSEITDNPEYKEGLAGVIDASNVYYGILALKARIVYLERVLNFVVQQDLADGVAQKAVKEEALAALGRESSNESSNEI